MDTVIVNESKVFVVASIIRTSQKTNNPFARKFIAERIFGLFLIGDDGFYLESTMIAGQIRMNGKSAILDGCSGSSGVLGSAHGK